MARSTLAGVRPPAVTAPPRIVVAAPASSAGKTTVALALMAALRRRGLAVAPFKVGPDYIDPSLHRRACGRASYNLDAYLAGRDGVGRSFGRGLAADDGARADVAVVEGVMGLFDGVRGDSLEGTTAEAAAILRAPVVLVVDASASAGSVGALLHGFRTYEPTVEVAGVVFNRVAGPGHVRHLEPAARRSGVRCLGALPRDAAVAIPERKLGLLPSDEEDRVTPILERLADAAERGIDLDGLLAIARSAPAIDLPLPAPTNATGRPVRIAWADDEAFTFSYVENRDLLADLGAEIVPFSPLRDAALPAGLGGVWIGGGFPERFADRLAANRSILDSIRAFAEAGGVVHAECGGFMLLCEWLEDEAGRRHRMAGIVPGGTRMTDRLQRFGYAEATTLVETPFGPAGTTLRGHRFHYSAYLGDESNGAYRVRRPDGSASNREGWAAWRTLATYVHLHLGGAPEAAARFVEACRTFVP